MSRAGNEDAWGLSLPGRRWSSLGSIARNVELANLRGFYLWFLYKLQQFTEDWRFQLDNFFDAKYFGWWNENLEICTIRQGISPFGPKSFSGPETLHAYGKRHMRENKDQPPSSGSRSDPNVDGIASR